MGIDLTQWLLRHISTPGEGAARVAVLMSGDETREWDSWVIDPEADLKQQATEIVKEATEVVKALGPELPKRRHAFLLQLKTFERARHLGQQTLSVTGTSADNILQSSAADAAAMAMTAISSLWKQSLEVVGNQLAAQSQAIEKLHGQLLSTYTADIERKKVEAENTTISSEQTEKLVTLVTEQAPVIIEMASHYMKNKKD